MDHRILVLDDEELFRKLVIKCLAPVGHTIDCVDNYESAIEMLKSQRYSLVLVDFILVSDKTGLDLIQAVAGELEETPVIMITGNPSLDLAIEAFESGVYDFLTKPLDLGKLKRVCSRALDHYEMQETQKKLTQDLIDKNRELKIANSKLVDALEEAKTFQAHLASSKKLAGIGEMTASVAHEFNNILGAIRGYTQLASRKPNDSDFLLNSHKKIKGAVDRAIKVVSNLLLFSKRIKPEMEHANFNQAITETIALSQHHLELREVSVITNLAPVEPFLFDVGQMQQVFLNLVTNASHAMEGGGKLIIETTVEHGLAVAKFADNGKGIPNENLDKIWIPFFTTKRKILKEDDNIGSGLGLYVSRQIVESHGGSIDVSSETDKGTIFTIKIPLERDQVQDTSNEDVSEKLAEIERALEKDSLFTKGVGLGALVVDDEPDIRQVLSKFLEDKGFQTMEAEDGKECLNLLRSNPGSFHLIFMDHHMPRIDGEQALHVIKDEFPEPSVFMMSGFGGPNTADRMLSLGAERYISKPFDLDELDEFIDEEIQKFLRKPKVESIK